jgi:hypothetical protein
MSNEYDTDMRCNPSTKSCDFVKTQANQQINVS